MDGKVQSGFRLAPGGNPQVSARATAWWLSAVRSIRLNTLGMSAQKWQASAFRHSGRDMPPFGSSAHLVDGLWDGDGGGAAVDQGGQLVEADDAEEVAQQAGAVGDGSLQAVASAVVGD